MDGYLHALAYPRDWSCSGYRQRGGNSRWKFGTLEVLQVYDPMVEGCLVKRPGVGKSASKAVRRLATAITFVASGLVHEMMFWCACRCPSGRNTHRAVTAGSRVCDVACLLRRYVKGYMPGISGGWLLWFTLQSPLLLAESALRTLAQRQRLRVPAVLGNVLTWIVLLCVAHLTYFRQDAVSGLQDDCRQDLQRTYGPLWSRMQGYLGQA